MAKRLKTIEWPTKFHAGDGGVAGAANVFNLGTQSLYCPETTGRIFRSVLYCVGVSDQVGTATSITSASLRIGLASSADEVHTNTTTITNSGENASYFVVEDFTGYFNAVWTSGSAVTVRYGAHFGAISCENLSGKLIMTYEFDDTGQDTLIKTVRIPIEGMTGSLTATYNAVGQLRNNIPALNTWLPEGNKVYRSIFLETWNNTEHLTSTTSMALYYRHNGVTDIVDDPHIGNLNSATNFYRVDDLTTSYLWPSASQTLEAMTDSGPSAFFCCLTPVLYVTYEYSVAASTAVMNSVIVPLGDTDSKRVEDAAAGDSTRLVGEFWIPEDSPMLAQSAVMFTAQSPANPVFDCRIGSQPSRTYTFLNTVRCGGMEWGRIASVSGGLAIARGYNTCSVDIFATVANDNNGLSAYLMLNYTSSIAPGGPETHNKTILYKNKTFAPTGTRFTVSATSSITPNIPETDYFISAGPWLTSYYVWGGTAAINPWAQVTAEYQAGEGIGAGGGIGWPMLADYALSSDGEVGMNLHYANCRSSWKLWSRDFDQARMDLETTRDWRFFLAPTGIPQTVLGFTYHSQAFVISGTLSNYTGDGSGISVYAHDSLTNTLINSASSVSGGSYSMKVFDNARTYYAQAWQDATHLGRSGNGNPPRA